MEQIEEQLKTIDIFRRMLVPNCDTRKDAETTMVFLIEYFVPTESKREQLKKEYNLKSA